MPSPLPELPHRPLPPDENPPFLGTWQRVYFAVLAYLAVVIALMYLFTAAFNK